MFWLYYSCMAIIWGFSQPIADSPLCWEQECIEICIENTSECTIECKWVNWCTEGAKSVS
jgi:hypothetical protein